MEPLNMQNNSNSYWQDPKSQQGVNKDSELCL